MSWLSIPLPNPFKSLQFTDDDDDQEPVSEQESSQQSQDDAVSPAGGVKDDLSAIGETIGRQFRGVAAFLAPPPLPENAATSSSGGGGDVDKTFAGIRSDLAEIGGSFKTSLSLFSSNKAVTGISKLASGLLQLNEENKDGDNGGEENNDDGDEEEEEEDEGLGITDEVIEFASQISDRPELWIDFPLALNKEFDMSDVQFEHVSVIEQLVPSLADLRSRLSSDMSDKRFWMIYFILLLPRLNEDDMDLLSTPEIVDARETLLLLLRTKKNTETDEVDSKNPQLDRSSELDKRVNDADNEKSQSVEKVTISENSNASRSTEINESDNTEKHMEEEDGNKADGTETNRIQSSKEKAVDNNSNAKVVNEEHEKIDQWLQEEEAETAGTSASAPKRFQSEDDVSFSDLEDDDNDLNRPSGSGPTQSTRVSSPEGSSNEWVRLNKNVGSKDSQLRGQSSSRDRESEGYESSDWLKVDDDFDP